MDGPELWGMFLPRIRGEDVGRKRPCLSGRDLSQRWHLQNPTGAVTIPMTVASYALAAAFMSCVVMMVGMPLGRRNCIIIGNVLITIGGVIQAASYSVPQIIVARVICVS
jgi:MFS family permease